MCRIEKNTIFKISASGHQSLIRPEHLPVKILQPGKSHSGDERTQPGRNRDRPYPKVLRQTAQNHTLAAEDPGISRSSLYRKMSNGKKKKNRQEISI